MPKGLQGFQKGNSYGSVRKGKHYVKKPTYRALHNRIEISLGKPSKCSHCGVEKEGKHKFHWANISKKYKKDLNDWIRLCVPCHMKFDKHWEIRRKIYGSNGRSN